MRALYTASATAVGGRAGRVVSSDNVLDLDLQTPKQMGGSGDHGTNPEQLFAAGYSACFDSALNLMISQKKLEEVTATSVTAHVSIYPTAKNGFKLGVEMAVEVEGVSKETAQELVESAHQVCPYSNATRGNIDVTFTIL